MNVDVDPKIYNKFSHWFFLKSVDRWWNHASRNCTKIMTYVRVAPTIWKTISIVIVNNNVIENIYKYQIQAERQLTENARVLSIVMKSSNLHEIFCWMSCNIKLSNLQLEKSKIVNDMFVDHWMLLTNRFSFGLDESIGIAVNFIRTFAIYSRIFFLTIFIV